MIRSIFEIYDDDLDFKNSFVNDQRAAEMFATQHAEEYGIRIAVMLRVPVADFPELRVIAVYDAEGRQVWSSDVYEPELVPA